LALHDATITIVQFDGQYAACLQVHVGAGAAKVAPSLRHGRDGGLGGLFGGSTPPAGPCFSILPRHDATLRILTLPSQDAAEIASMVALGAADLVPYPIEEMRVAHQCLASLPSGESRVLVVLVRHATVDAHIAAMAEAGLEPRQIYLSTACLVAAAADLDATGDVALLHMEPRSLELVAVRGGELLFSRGVVQGAPWDFAEPHGRELLAYEARELLAAYRREKDDGRGADVIHVSASGFPPDRVAALLAEATGKDCRAAETGQDLSPGGEYCPATLAGALRLARGGGPLTLPLAPPALARRRAVKGAMYRLAHGLLLAAIILAPLLIWFGQAVWQRQQLIASLREEIAAVAPGAQGVAAKQHGLQIISRQVERDGSFLELLAGIAAAAPASGLNLTRIQYDREEGLNLWGRALTKDLVLKDFLGALRGQAEGNLAPFSRAHSLYETAGTELGEPIINFHVTVPLPEEGPHDGT